MRTLSHILPSSSCPWTGVDLSVRAIGPVARQMGYLLLPLCQIRLPHLVTAAVDVVAVGKHVSPACVLFTPYGSINAFPMPISDCS